MNNMKKVAIILKYDPISQKIAGSGYSVAKAMGTIVYLIPVISSTEYCVPDNSLLMDLTGMLT
ncbi:MAG: hypothetical protein DI538_18140 [Azospira oryzae]|nr:MAG: hypothetical protein DI538_18140 [Azospira oryzae]